MNKDRLSSDNLPNLQTEKSLNIIENLSNDLFFEIFEYLDGYHVYEAFSNLNQRFDNLIISVPRLNIHFSKHSKLTSEYICEQIIEPNKHRILSLSISGKLMLKSFLKSIVFNSSFNRLQSLTITDINQDRIQPFLLQISELPCLYALNIVTGRGYLTHEEVFFIIFCLPMLTYAKISARIHWDRYYRREKITQTNWNGIEYLNIHACSLDELPVLISNTRQLHHLTCGNLSGYYSRPIGEISREQSNLTHLIINNCYATFSDLEIFIKQYCFHIEVFRLNVHEDANYLNADCWESLISKCMPYLRTFEFNFDEIFKENTVLNSHHSLLPGFLSPFWIDRKWFLDLKTDRSFTSQSNIIYSVKSSVQDRHDIELSFNPSRSAKCDYLFIQNISSIFTCIPIITLNINDYCVKELLFNLILFLPNLRILKVLSLSTNEIAEKIINLYQSALNNNHITKVNLKKMTKFEEIYFLIDLCQRMECLEVKYNINIDIQSLVRCILTKHIPHLRSICLCNTLNDDKLVQQLVTMIDEEKLSDDYTIKRVLDRIYLTRTSH